MYKQLVILTGLFLPFILNAQILQGRVFREGSDSVIAKASVYYSGSLNATITDENGMFKLPAMPGKIPLIISCLGYQSETVINYNTEEQLIVYLKPKSAQLREVVIRNDGMTREEKVRLFKAEFLGTSEYARSCNITNIDDIDLAYSKKTKTLSAYCNTPILIENNKLGYSLKYFLDKFVKTPKNTSFSGSFIFHENADTSDLSQINNNRKSAYRGSRMEFIRSVWSKNPEGSGFKILSPFYDPVPVDSILTGDALTGKFLNIKNKILITHKKNPGRFAHLTQNTSNSYIDKVGFYDTSLRWSGFMAAQRVGDMLPFEYVFSPDNPSQYSVTKIKDDQVKGQKAKRLPYDLLIMKPIFLTINNKSDQRLVIKKWQTPINYKVFGNLGAYTDKKIDSFFQQLAQLTGIQITETKVDSEVNFYILADGNPNKFTTILTPEAIEYLKRPGSDGSYYTTTDEGFESMVQMIGLNQQPPDEIVWSMVQKKIMKGLGFFGVTEDKANSIFYRRLNVVPDSLSDFDTKVIRILYHPSVKSGMTEKNFDEVLKGSDFK